ncbi:MAG: hypothetical protein R6V86_03470 [Spirochaetia bacterium]
MEYFATTPSQLSKILRARRGSLDLTQQEVANFVELLPNLSLGASRVLLNALQTSIDI